jgi:hypothetical protein
MRPVSAPETTFSVPAIVHAAVDFPHLHRRIPPPLKTIVGGAATLLSMVPPCSTNPGFAVAIEAIGTLVNRVVAESEC